MYNFVGARMTHLQVRAYWLFLPPVAPSRLWFHWSKCSQIYARCLSARSTSFQVQDSRRWLIEASVSSNWSVMTPVTYAKFDGASAWPVQSGAECSGKQYIGPTVSVLNVCSLSPFSHNSIQPENSSPTKAHPQYVFLQGF